jgi:ribonuclease G
LREILINVGPRETRAALIEESIVQEIFIERASRGRLVSNLYKGRVMRVLPGMQAAFLDIGLERTAFLHVDDIVRPPLEEGEPAPTGTTTEVDVRRLLSPGDELLVQVIKDPIGTKGARLTTFVTLPARYLVYLPQGEGIGVSAKIEEEDERVRLKTLLGQLRPEGGGFILRTAAQGATAEGLREDIEYLERLWRHVRQRALASPPGAVVHEDLPLALRLLRDELSRGVEVVRVDCAETLARMREFAAEFMPGVAAQLELYGGPRPIFDLHGVEAEIGRALERRVMLRSGGHLVIEQTEAMTTIDVNTGGYVGHRNLEETSFRTNLEAAEAIGRQLRLRNLGGIIIIDFIDMHAESHRRQILAALERSLTGDRAQSRIVSLSPLGLVEMTRKRTRESLSHLLCEPCPACEGRGFVKTAETVCHEIFRELQRQESTGDVLVLAHPAVVDRLLEAESAALGALQSAAGRAVRLQVEALYGVDQFDVVAL